MIRPQTGTRCENWLAITQMGLHRRAHSACMTWEQALSSVSVPTGYQHAVDSQCTNCFHLDDKQAVHDLPRRVSVHGKQLAVGVLVLSVWLHSSPLHGLVFALRPQHDICFIAADLRRSCTAHQGHRVFA